MSAPADVRYLKPAQAARIWPTAGRSPHPSKVVRAIVDGTRSKQRPGERIKLRAVHNGQRWLTTSAWIEEYVCAIATDRAGRPPEVALKQRAQAAIARLRANGW
jgi:hypothetical protein